MNVDDLIAKVKGNLATEEEWDKAYEIYYEIGKIEERLSRKRGLEAGGSDSDIDKINPEWYKWLKDKIGIEAVDVCELFNFNRGNALKYLLRAGAKTEKGYSVPEKELEDLKKAKWYIEREIAQLEKTLNPMSHLDFSNLQTFKDVDWRKEANEYYKAKEEEKRKEEDD